MSIEQTLAYIDSLCEADPSLAESLFTVLTERRNRKKAADAGSPQDSDRAASPTGNRASYMATERTFGGLREPVEDDRQPTDLTAEYANGLMLPDERQPSTADKLRALFLAKPSSHRITPTKVISADEFSYRATSGGLLSPPE